ncbi:MAG: protein-disulfide reductase DsbD family protein [Burkholderiaceae bacterium]|nr:protein-disulfide reductase DsbD family protein [Burkholderiaceae bacterium]
MSLNLLRHLAIAIFLIASTALSTGAQAQIAFKPSGGRADTAGGAVVTTPHVRAELLAHAPEGVGPGKLLWLGLHLVHQPGWHTYWKNPGDSGLATELQWQLPPGLGAGDIAWPVPQRLPIGNLANYGYEGELLLPVAMQVAPGFAPAADGTLTLRLQATWLVCRVECIPENGAFTLTLPVESATALHASTFAQAQARQAQPLNGASRATVQGERLQLRVAGLPAHLRGRTLAVFPETPEVLVPAARLGRDWTQAWDGAVWTADLPLSPQRGDTPDRLPLVLAVEGDSETGWRTSATVEGRWAAAAKAQVSPALAAALAANAAPPVPAAPDSAPAPLKPYLGALLASLLGGLLLNLMPCVFPVLAIKVMGFAQHGTDRRAQRLSGAAYTVGVVLSFMALGGLLLALRAAGEQLGWGFQLQSPAVVAALAALFTLIGLNLAGVFEFGMFVPGRLAALQARHPVGDAFLSGVLAVAVASPCTAPFMGASLGVAVTLPASQALGVFAALGLGMALPYLAASLAPAVVRWLPRPGAWMETFRRAMAFPMFATVVWLVWVLGQQSGIDGAATLLMLLVAGSSVVWSLTLAGRTRVVFASVLIAATALFMGAWGPNITETPAQALPASAQGAGPSTLGASGASGATGSLALWQPWSAEEVGRLTAAGQPVFVDFTAAWCITCQYNKRNALADPALLADLAAKKVQLLRADWTRRDPAITAALTQLGRSGVPVYVLHAPGKAPVVFTEILSGDAVRQAIARL